MNKHLLSLLIIFSASALLTSCKKKEQEDTVSPPVAARLAYVVNEGSFGAGNASVTLIDLDANKVYINAFQAANGFALGDVAQSMAVHNGVGYVMVNASGKVEVVKAESMESLATITGFQGPRYFVAKGSKGYVSDWFSNSVAVVDLNTNTIIKSIAVGQGPEQMLISGNRLFVANVGGWGNDSTVSVIDLNSETVETTLTVGLNPNSLQLDINGKIWILCGGTIGPDFTGGTVDDVGGSIYKVNPTTLAIEQQLSFGSADHPSKLCMNPERDELYFLNGIDGYTGNVMRMYINSASVPSVPVISRQFYGLGIDPVTGNIYCGHSPGFTVNGTLLRYNESFQKIDSVQVGVSPNGFCFR